MEMRKKKTKFWSKPKKECNSWRNDKIFGDNNKRWLRLKLPNLHDVKLVRKRWRLRLTNNLAFSIFNWSMNLAWSELLRKKCQKLHKSQKLELYYVAFIPMYHVSQFHPQLWTGMGVKWKLSLVLECFKFWNEKRLFSANRPKLIFS